MKKIFMLLALSASFIFAEVNLQTASKNELMSIKGIGAKKADAIIKYRKTHKIKSADDLKNIKGFGKGIINNVKKDIKVKKASKKKGAKTTHKLKTNKKEKINKKLAEKTNSLKNKLPEK